MAPGLTTSSQWARSSRQNRSVNALADVAIRACICSGVAVPPAPNGTIWAYMNPPITAMS